MKHWLFIFIVGLIFCVSGATAFENDAPLEDPLLESRARTLAKEIRCLVCQNQSIFDSDADLAKDLRQIVRERITEGDDDRAVTEFLVSRYGDFVLLKPPVKTKTYVLWFGPAVILFIAGLGVLRFLRNLPGKGTGPEALSSAERKRVTDLTSDREVD